MKNIAAIRYIIAVAAAVACVASVPNVSEAASPTSNSGGSWARNQLVEYRWREGDEPPSWMAAAINHAAARSTATREAKAARFSYNPAAVSWIAYTNDMARGAIGWTPYKDPPNDFRVKLRKQGYVLDDVGPLEWCQFTEVPTPGCFDAEMIALHELGHVQGMGHVRRSAYPLPNWTDSVMHGYPPGVRSHPREGWDQDWFGPCDVARLQLKYEPLLPSTRYSTCLSLKTKLGLTARPGPAEVVGGIQFTATLKIAGSENTVLAGDAIDDRRVVLQRRRQGGSRWIDQVVMTPLDDGTGRYRAIAVPAPNDKWRARFRKPGGEGLRATSSDPYVLGDENEDPDDPLVDFY